MRSRADVVGENGWRMKSGVPVIRNLFPAVRHDPADCQEAERGQSLDLLVTNRVYAGAVKLKGGDGVENTAHVKDTSWCGKKFHEKN